MTSVFRLIDGATVMGRWRSVDDARWREVARGGARWRAGSCVGWLKDKGSLEQCECFYIVTNIKAACVVNRSVVIFISNYYRGCIVVLAVWLQCGCNLVVWFQQWRDAMREKVRRCEDHGTLPLHCGLEQTRIET